MKFFNIYLIEYAINSILRQKSKNIFIVTVFTMLVFLLSSIFFISSSLKYELNLTLDSLPQIIVQKVKAGRHYDIDLYVLDDILTINGVSDANARVWGYYYFENAKVNFSVIGVDRFDTQYKTSLSNIVNNFKIDSNNSMIVGLGVKKILKDNYYNEYFNFIKPDGTLKRVYISAVFNSNIELESNDMMVMDEKLVREIFNIDKNKATDIVVKVANPDEIDTVVSKIKLLYPDSKITTIKDLKVSYQNIFNYKKGVFSALFVVSIFTFFIIIYDKTSGLSSEQKREIGILKAIGWKVDDILKERFYEGFIISTISYILGVFLAFGFVYILQAPLLRDIFMGYSNLRVSFNLPFIFDIQTLFIVFLLSVPIYIGSTIIPSWKVATLEADEVIR